VPDGPVISHTRPEAQGVLMTKVRADQVCNPCHVAQRMRKTSGFWRCLVQSPGSSRWFPVILQLQHVSSCTGRSK
jgi:hypothetical protein